MDYRKAVKPTAMAWHCKQAEKEGWIPYDMEINASGVIKYAKFARENGDRLFLQPKGKQKYNRYVEYLPEYEARVKRLRAAEQIKRDARKKAREEKENGGSEIQ